MVDDLLLFNQTERMLVYIENRENGQLEQMNFALLFSFFSWNFLKFHLIKKSVLPFSTVSGLVWHWMNISHCYPLGRRHHILWDDIYLLAIERHLNHIRYLFFYLFFLIFQHCGYKLLWCCRVGDVMVNDGKRTMGRGK